MNLDNAQLICKFKGGSHSYGLQTPTSDIDFRGVFLNTDLPSIIGLKSGIHDNIVKQTDEEDSTYWELRRFFKLLQQGNTQAVELLYLGGEHFDKQTFDQLHPLFDRILINRTSLFDSTKFFKVLKGYAQGELRLANGERTGKLGGKRCEAVDKYGFSPKNFVQLFRLLWAGEWLYRTGLFPVNVRQFDPQFADYLMGVKTKPDVFHKNGLNKLAAELEAKLDNTYSKTTVKYEFDEALANRYVLEAYMPLLEQYA